jgi:hypothetical protein
VCIAAFQLTLLLLLLLCIVRWLIRWRLRAACHALLVNIKYNNSRPTNAAAAAVHCVLAHQVEVERSLPRFSGDACAPRLAELLRRFLRLRAEMAHFNINLQYYINLEVLECE